MITQTVMMLAVRSTIGTADILLFVLADIIWHPNSYLLSQLQVLFHLGSALSIMGLCIHHDAKSVAKQPSINPFWPIFVFIV